MFSQPCLKPKQLAIVALSKNIFCSLVQKLSEFYSLSDLAPEWCPPLSTRVNSCCIILLLHVSFHLGPLSTLSGLVFLRITLINGAYNAVNNIGVKYTNRKHVDNIITFFKAAAIKTTNTVKHYNYTYIRK
jgi:hypothetical protein